MKGGAPTFKEFYNGQVAKYSAKSLVFMESIQQMKEAILKKYKCIPVVKLFDYYKRSSGLASANQNAQYYYHRLQYYLDYYDIYYQKYQISKMTDLFVSNETELKNPLPSMAVDQEESDNAKTELEKAIAKENKEQYEVNVAKQNLDETRNRLNTLQLSKKNADEAILRANAALTSAKSDLTDAEKELKDLNAKINKQKFYTVAKISEIKGNIKDYETRIQNEKDPTKKNRLNGLKENLDNQVNEYNELMKLLADKNVLPNAQAKVKKATEKVKEVNTILQNETQTRNTSESQLITATTNVNTAESKLATVSSELAKATQERQTAEIFANLKREKAEKSKNGTIKPEKKGLLLPLALHVEPSLTYQQYNRAIFNYIKEVTEYDTFFMWNNKTDIGVYFYYDTDKNYKSTSNQISTLGLYRDPTNTKFVTLYNITPLIQTFLQLNSNLNSNPSLLFGRTRSKTKVTDLEFKPTRTLYNLFPTYESKYILPLLLYAFQKNDLGVTNAELKLLNNKTGGIIEIGNNGLMKNIAKDTIQIKYTSPIEYVDQNYKIQLNPNNKQLFNYNLTPNSISTLTFVPYNLKGGNPKNYTKKRKIFKNKSFRVKGSKRDLTFLPEIPPHSIFHYPVAIKPASHPYTRRVRHYRNKSMRV